MQPYFLPYIGYFQLMGAVDVFIVYDNIKYTKKGWINRNRMLQNGSDVMFSLPLRKDSDSLDVVQRSLAPDFNRSKILQSFKGAYARAPQFEPTFALLERIIRHPEDNLFHFILHALLQTCAHLGLNTEIRVSSTIEIDHTLKAQDKVLALCESVGARTYINAIGGVGLYSGEAFQARGMELKFLQSNAFVYPQGHHPFVPWLSILDVLMFNPLPSIKRQIDTGFHLV